MTDPEKMVYSPSRIKLFASCPAAFKRHYIDGEVGVTCAPFFYGSLVHAIAHTYNRQCVLKRVPADPGAMPEIVNAHFWSTDQTGIPADEYQSVLDLCVRLAARQVIDYETFAGAEDRMHMRVNGYGFQGIVDIHWIDGPFAVVRDYKTQRNMLTPAELVNDFKMRCYAALEFASFPHLEGVWVEHDYLRWGAVRRSERMLTKEDADRTKEEIWQRIERIIGELEYPYTPGDWCAVCEYKRDCPRLAEAEKCGPFPDPITTADQARAVLDELVALGLATTDRKTALKAWVNGYGAVRGNGYEFGPRESRGVEYDVARVMAAFPEAAEALAALRVDKRGLAALAKADDELAKRLEEIAVETVTTRTDLHKIKGENDE